MTTSYKPRAGCVDYVQTFCPTSAHIRSGSALEITKPSHLTDERLGVSDVEASCPTCDNFLDRCTGHTGHLELPLPVYRAFFIERLLTLLNCVCIGCGRLKLPRDHPQYAYIGHLPREQRLRAMVLAVAKLTTKYCGTKLSLQDSASFDALPNEQKLKLPCHKPYVKVQFEDREHLFLKFIVTLTDADGVAREGNPFWRPLVIGPEDIFGILSAMDGETRRMLGCDEWNSPAATMWDVIPVPSNNTRPCHTFGGIGVGKRRSYNDWSKLLRNILLARDALQRKMDKGTEHINCCVYSNGKTEFKNFEDCLVSLAHKNTTEPPPLLSSSKKRGRAIMKNANNYGAIEAAWRHLTQQIAAFHAYKYKKYMNNGSKFGKPLVNVEERYKHQKAGRFRGNIIARRVNNACRGVLDGSIHLQPYCVGIPRAAAMALCVTCPVTPYNVAVLQRYILNGPFTHPGANYVVLHTGEEINLSYFDNRRDIDVSTLRSVSRHVINGDPVIANRMPTLHKPSMQGFEAVIVSGNAIRLHPCVFTPFGADCDGDEMNVHVPQTFGSIAEVTTLFSVQENIVKDGKVWVKFIQNAVIGAYLLTRDESPLAFERATAMQLLADAVDVWELPRAAIASRAGRPELWTGKQIVSCLFPTDFCIDTHDLCIVNGVLVRGTLTDATLNGPQGILMHLVRDYPVSSADTHHGVAVKFLYEAYLLFQRVVDQEGLSVGYFDCSVRDRHPTAAGVVVPASLRASVRMLGTLPANVARLNRYVEDRFPGHLPGTHDLDVETHLRQHVEAINTQSCTAVMAYHTARDASRQENGILHMIHSGAKGSTQVMNQMCGMVGQTYVLQERSQEVSSHVRPGHHNMTAYGLITHNYSDGVDLPAFIAEAPATCESVLKKNKGTSEGGYTVRKMTTCAMGVVVDRENRVVDTKGHVIWNVYGSDGYDSKLLTSVHALAGDLPPPELARQFEVLQYGHFGTAVTGMTLSPEACLAWSAQKRQSATRQGAQATLARLLALHAQVCSSAAHTGGGGGEQQPPVLRLPFCFKHLMVRCRGAFIGTTTTPLTPVDLAKFTDMLWTLLIEESVVRHDNSVLQLQVRLWCSTRQLLREGCATLPQLLWLSEEIVRLLRQALVVPGESVGVVSTQSLGEPFVQQSLKAPHLNRKFPVSMGGNKRVANIVDGNYANPTMCVVLHPHVTEDDATLFGLSLVTLRLHEVCVNWPTWQLSTLALTVVFDIDPTLYYARGVCLSKIAAGLCTTVHVPPSHIHYTFEDDPGPPALSLDILFTSDLWQKTCGQSSVKEAATVAANIVFNLFRTIPVGGLREVSNFVVEKHATTGAWSLFTLGSNLAYVLRQPEVDASQTVSNDASEVQHVFGLLAARKSIEFELQVVMSGMADNRHVSLLARLMVSESNLKGMKIMQLGEHLPPLQRAAFEQGPKQMLQYCGDSQRDTATTICGAAMTNKLMRVGTGYDLDIRSTDPRTVYSLKPLRISQYVHSPKVDGVKVDLVFFQHAKTGTNACCLVDRAFQVYDMPVHRLRAPALFAGTVLSGDLVALPNTTPTRYCLVVYDCVMSCGNTCAYLRYDQRIEIAREILHHMMMMSGESESESESEGGGGGGGGTLVPFDLGGSAPYALPMVPSRAKYSANICTLARHVLPFGLIIKPLFALESVQGFQRDVIDAGLYPLPTDGVVFTNASDAATPFSTNPKTILKWKPARVNYSEHSIDFVVTFCREPGTTLHPLHQPDKRSPHNYALYRPDVGTVSLWLRQGPGLPLFLFAYTSMSPFLATVTEGSVVECYWYFDDKAWRGHRRRLKAANTLTTGTLTIQNIIENLTLAELVDPILPHTQKKQQTTHVQTITL
jgi:DNA-directed RNA polymerase beta' subunit